MTTPIATKNIDFATLCLRDALDLAVLIEQEAKDRYEEFAHQMKSHRAPDAARFFELMAGNEAKHRAALAERRAALFGAAPCAVSWQMLFDVEAPDYDEARAYMTARGALATALKSEEKAWNFFARALPQLRDAGVRDLFHELLAEEVEHQQLVKRELAKLPPDDEFKQEDFEDEPVGQD